MKALLLTVFVGLATLLGAQEGAGRPKISGIDHVVFYTTAPDGLARLYSEILGLAAADRSEPGLIRRYLVGTQWVGYSAAPDPAATNRLEHMAFTTDNAEALRVYLAKKGISVPASIQPTQDGSRTFAVKDPEGYTIEFVERANTGASKAAADPVSRRIIHAGLIVYDRAAADRFYRDILGFRLYWHGGMQPQRDDWVAMQVPNGTDWMEYMLNMSAHPDLKTTGVMNHISLGVVDMKQAEAKLVVHGWKAHGDEHSQMGKDGKWQLNLFDPDWSRVELMEFRPVQKPCCSDFLTPHPSGE